MGCQSVQYIQLIGRFLFQFCMKTGEKGLGALHRPGCLGSDTVGDAFGDFEFGPAYFDRSVVRNSFGDAQRDDGPAVMLGCEDPEVAHDFQMDERPGIQSEHILVPFVLGIAPFGKNFSVQQQFFPVY